MRNATTATEKQRPKLRVRVQPHQIKTLTLTIVAPNVAATVIMLESAFGLVRIF